MSGDPDAISVAAAERRRLRQAQQAGARRTSMRDVLVGTAEGCADVSLALERGRSHRVRVVAVGHDVVVATADSGRMLVVGLDAIRSIVLHRATPGAAAMEWTGGRAVDWSGAHELSEGFRMGDILAHSLAQRPRISAWLGNDQMSGTLMSVGLDVAVMATEGSGETAYVRLDSATEIWVSSSL